MERKLTIPSTDWLTDAMVEPLAIAICYGGFATQQMRLDPVAYWERVHAERKAEYRQVARRLIGLVQVSGRFVPRRPDDDTLGRYMGAMRLSNAANARRHYAALFDALPTIWGEYAENRESGG